MKSRFAGLFFMVSFFFQVMTVTGQQADSGDNSIPVPKGSSEREVIELACKVRPSPRQLAWQEMEITTFLHFSMNTFYNQEWGSGREDPERFNPERLDAKQWVKVCKDAGSRCVILTCKHHDGFCLWPSKFTSHSVASSKWKSGEGDVVAEVSKACRNAGLGFGIYLSPWDRHEKSYGTDAYNQYFINQLTELLTQYGDISEVWFDGACGEGTNGKKQVYDWNRYYALVRKLQPKAVIAVMGPDVRWVGTESGYGRETEWSVVPADLSIQDSIAAGSQQEATYEGFIPSGDMTDLDLGSREAISKASSLIWYPSEVDVSIRPGWFWHKSENERVKKPEKLWDIYFSSVGRNSVLLLNIPPNDEGLIDEVDIQALNGWKKAIDQTFKQNLAERAIVHAGSVEPEKSGILTDHNLGTFASPSSPGWKYEIELGGIRTFDILCLQENIRFGQKIEKFSLQAWQGDKWIPVTSGTTVGYKRLLRFEQISTNRVQLLIEESRDIPMLSEFGLYLGPPLVSAVPATAIFTGSQSVMLESNSKDASIHYSLDGSEPEISSPVYNSPIILTEPTEVRYIAIRPGGESSFVGKSSYGKALQTIYLKQGPDPQYSGSGPATLADGRHGSTDFMDGRWLGWNGTAMEATLQVNNSKDAHKINVSFLESTASWIFLPEKVHIFISENGSDFIEAYVVPFIPPDSEHQQILPITISYSGRIKAIRVVADPLRNIPEWHPGKGNPAWIFCDEISVE